MANVRTTLDTRRAKSDGTFNIIFRITHQRKVYTINSGISVQKEHWNTNKREVVYRHPNAKLINLKLYERHYKIQRVLLELDDEFTIQNLRNTLDGKPRGKTFKKFKEFADEVIQQMMNVKRVGNALVYQTGVNRLINYCGKDVSFEEIDYKLLDGFIHHLQASGLKQNSIGNYLRSIRAIYNKGIKSKLVDRSYYPFHDIKIKSQRTAKRAISKADIKRLSTLHFEENSAPWRALKCFILSFYLRGISFTDMAYLKQSNIINGRIQYERRKTHKLYSVKLFSSAEEIMNYFHRQENEYLLPVLPNNIIEDSLEAKRIIKQWIKTTNHYLKRLSLEVKSEIPITTYCSRHSFASIAKHMGYSNEMIAESLGHEYGNKITNIYLDAFDINKVDEMHHDVITCSTN